MAKNLRAGVILGIPSRSVKIDLHYPTLLCAIVLGGSFVFTVR